MRATWEATRAIETKRAIVERVCVVAMRMTMALQIQADLQRCRQVVCGVVRWWVRGLSLSTLFGLVFGAARMPAYYRSDPTAPFRR